MISAPIPFAFKLDSIPRLAQMNAPTIDGQPDTNARQNCGETATAIIAKWSTGITEYPDTIHDMELGEQYLGPESNLQISDFLSGACEIDNTLLLSGTVGNFEGYIHLYLSVGQPLIHLRDAGDHKNGHWTVIYGCDGNDQAGVQNVLSINTYDASDIEESLQDAWKNSLLVSPSQRMLIGIRRQRCITTNPHLT